MQQVLQELPRTLAYIGVNVGVLAVTLLLSTSDNVGAGLGLGLFGVLSIIRLRSSSLAQGEVAYFFAALALGLLGGIESHIIIVAILMALILASLWVGDHPALMRRNRNQTVTIDRAISDEDELVGELEDLLGATVRNVDLKSLDLVNDTTIVEVHYRLHRRSRKAKPPARLEADNAQQISQQLQDATPQGPHLIQDAPRQDPVQVHPTAQQVWPEPPSHDSAASAATAPPRYDWITGNRSQHASQQRAQSTTPPPPMVHPHYN